FLHLFPGGDDQNLFRLPETVRQNDRSAHHLVGVLGIHTETHRNLDRLIEFCVFDFLQKRDRFLQRVRFFSNRCPSLGDVLTWFSHLSSPSPTAQRCFEEPWCVDQLNLSSSAQRRTCFSVPPIRLLAARSP